MRIEKTICFFVEHCFEKDTGTKFITTRLGNPQNVPNSIACQKLCQDTAECEFWTTYNAGGTCWLSTSDSEKFHYSGQITGPKFCGENKSSISQC